MGNYPAPLDCGQSGQLRGGPPELAAGCSAVATVCDRRIRAHRAPLQSHRFEIRTVPPATGRHSVFAKPSFMSLRCLSMKRRIALACITAVFLFSFARVQAQDDQYIRIYSLIQEGDS